MRWRDDGFFLTGNEEELASRRPKKSQLYQVFDIAVLPRVFAISLQLRNHVHLEIANFRATFR